MKSTATAAAVLVLAVLLLAAAPAFAQEDDVSSMPATGFPAGSPPPPGPPGSNIPDYEFRDGWVYIDGDMGVNCEGFAASIDVERTPAGDIPAEAFKALEGCAEAGLLPPSVAAKVRASSDSPPDGGDELPDTGGPALPALACASAALVAAGVLLVRKATG